MSPLAVSLRFLQTQPDERLVALARAGHERAFEALVRRYRGPLLAYCRRVAPHGTSPEDILQQGLLQAWKALSGGSEVRDARAWLYRIVHNVAISALRASGDLPDGVIPGSGAPGVEQLVEQRMAAREALAGLAALPDLQRQVMVSTALDGASHEEIAAALGLSSGSVRGLIYRARASLRAAAAAVIPAPVIDWALRQPSRPGRSPGMYETVAGGGSAGLAGAGSSGLLGGGSAGLGAIVVKGGAFLAAGAIAGGAVIVAGHSAGHAVSSRSAADAAAHVRHPGADPASSGPQAIETGGSGSRGAARAGSDASAKSTGHRDGSGARGSGGDGRGDRTGSGGSGHDSSGGGDGHRGGAGGSGGSDGGSGRSDGGGGDGGATTAAVGIDGGSSSGSGSNSGSSDGGSSGSSGGGTSTGSSDGGSGSTTTSGGGTSTSGSSDGGSSGSSDGGSSSGSSDGGSLTTTTTTSGGH